MARVFPGVDPYLESQGLWPDFHVSFLAELRNAIADQLPESYVARIDERMNLVKVAAEEVRQVRPDVAVARHTAGRAAEPSAAPSTAGTLTLEPEIIPLKFLEEYREAYIEILHGPDWKLVSVVELLSPANKTGEGRHDYLTKRNSLMQLDVHLVELDFLSVGRRLPMGWPPREGDYYAYVARAERRPDCEVFAWTVRDPFPPIPIPLSAPDPDIRVDLAPLFSSVYDRARYARSIRYDAPLTTLLKPEDRAWAEGLARAPRGT